MCVVSMISDHYMRKWPVIPTNYPDTIFPSKTWPNHVEWDEYQELIRKAREYDKIHNQPDCQDLEKIKWEKAMKEWLAKMPQHPRRGQITSIADVKLS